MITEFIILLMIGLVMLVCSSMQVTELSTKNLCLGRVNKRLQERIDKAIEVLKYVESYKNIDDEEDDSKYVKLDVDELIEILKGNTKK